jgi:uncharacterized membrane protein
MVMNSILLQDDIKLVEDRIQSFEEKTGCELLLVVASSSDPYPGAAWRFGIIAGFIVSLLFSHFFHFHVEYLWPISYLTITLLMAWIGHFDWAKRFTLSDKEVARETAEKAIELFHRLGTSVVSHKVTAMIMVSVLEKQIHVLIDEKLKTEISQLELDELITIMKPHFRNGDMGAGFVQSITSLEEKILKDFNGRVSDVNPSQLKNTIHFL